MTNHKMDLTKLTSKLYEGKSKSTQNAITKVLGVIADLSDLIPNFELTLFPNMPEGVSAIVEDNYEYPGPRIGEYAHFKATYSPEDGEKHTWEVKDGEKDVYCEIQHHMNAGLDSWWITRPEDRKFVVISSENGSPYKLTQNNTPFKDLEQYNINGREDIYAVARLIGAGAVIPFIEVGKLQH